LARSVLKTRLWHWQPHLYLWKLLAKAH
jgi:hypothetical protein